MSFPNIEFSDHEPRDLLWSKGQPTAYPIMSQDQIDRFNEAFRAQIATDPEVGGRDD